jgi:hypothetical protein
MSILPASKTSPQVLNFRGVVVQFFAPFRFVLFETSAVGTFELRFPSLHYRREFGLIFLESFGNRRVGSFVSDRFGGGRKKTC